MDVREKLVELPIEDALLILREEHRQRTDSYTTYLEHGGKGDPAEEVGLDALAMAISALEKTKWISVKDRLPEYPGHYLVCTSINYWHGGCMDINGNHKYHPNGTPVGYDGSTMSVLDCYYDVAGHWNRVCDSHVTHWMPIPEPPKGE